VSSTCADVASTTLKVLEKAAGSAVPILSGAVSGVSAVLDTAKVERYFLLCEEVPFFNQLLHNSVACDAVERESTSLVTALSNLGRSRRSRPIKYAPSDA
jgi:hypothetical protein